MLGLNYYAWKLARKRYNVPVVIDLIFFFVIVKVVLYYCLPTLMRIGSDYQFVHVDRVSIFDLILLYSIELISWSVWIIALLSVFKIIRNKKKRMRVGEFYRLRYSESKIILAFLAMGFIVDRISVITGTNGIALLGIFKGLFFYSGLASGPLLMLLSLRYYGKSFFLLGVTCSLFALLSLSTRGAIVYLLLFCLYLAYFVLRDRIAKVIVSSTIVILAVAFLIFGGLFSGSIFIDERGDIYFDAGINIEKKGHRSPLEEIEWRFGASTRMGTAFVNLYNRGDSAGFNPILHSLMGFLPRSMNPDKPYPSTLYGDDIFSQGMYIIYREIHGYNTYSMVEFPTGGHFYWEFGMIGVLILSAISGFYVAICAHFFSKLGIVALPLMVSIFKPWGYMDPKIWVSDIVVQIYQIILPLILLVSIIRFMHSVYKSFNKSLSYPAQTNSRSVREISTPGPS